MTLTTITIPYTSASGNDLLLEQIVK